MGPAGNIFDQIAERAEARKLALGAKPRYPLDMQLAYLEDLGRRIRKSKLVIVDGACQCPADEVCGDKRCTRAAAFMEATAAAGHLLCGYVRFNPQFGRYVLP